MSDSFVCSSARLKCSFGTTAASLIILPARRIQLSGKPMGNLSDYKPVTNIPPFGMCRSLANPSVASATSAAMGTLTPMPCIPNTRTPWTGAKMDFKVSGQPALLKSCRLTCMWGGMITIMDDGQ